MATQKKRKGTSRPTCIGNKFASGNKGGRLREWDDGAITLETKALSSWIEDSRNRRFKIF